MPTFPLRATHQDPSVTASAGQGANDNPFESGGSPAPAAPAAPAPTSTFGAYDTGAYGGGGAAASSAYNASSSSYGGVGGGAYDVRPPP